MITTKHHECIIIWAGAAGIGVAIKLQELWIISLILEGDSVGASFYNWSAQTRFISPSFPGNAFGQTDLNSVSYDSSPGFMHKKEHVSGSEYGDYLNALVKSHHLNVSEGQRVTEVSKTNSVFSLKTTDAAYTCSYLISAVGEFQFPSHGGIIWAEHAEHSSEIKNYDSFEYTSEPVAIVGGYESSVDAAFALSKKGIHSHIFSPHPIDDTSTSDPSQILSLATLERFRALQQEGSITLTQTSISKIDQDAENYILTWADGNVYHFTSKPILATGFHSGLSYLWDLVSYRDDGNPLLVSDTDELQKTPGIFVVGPRVRHAEIIFCFIYKFRLRFGVIALEIAKRLGKNIDEEAVKTQWKHQGFYMENFNSCGDECVC